MVVARPGPGGTLAPFTNPISSKMPRASSDEDDGASSEASGMRLRRRRATKLTFGYNSDVERALRETSSESGSDEETGNQEIAATETPSGGARGRGGARGSARGGRGRGRGRGAKATPAGRATPAKKTKPADNEDEESDFKGSEAESESESAESDDDAAESESVETPSDDEPVKLSTTSKSKKTEDEADEEGKEGPKDADESPIEEPKAPPKKRGRTPGSKYKRAEVQDDPEKAGENVDGQLKEGPVEAKPARPAYKPPSAPEQSAESLADPNVQKLTDMIKTALEANGAVVAHAQPLDLTVKKGRPPTKGASSSTLNTHAPKTPAEPSGKGRESAVANGLAATASPAKALDPIPETPTPAEATLEPPSKRARGRARKTPLADENLVKLEEDSPTVAVPATPAPQPVLETPAPASRRGGRKRKIEEIKVEEAPATETAKEVKQPEAAETPSGTGANPEAEVAANTQAGPKQATKVFKVKQVNGRYQCYVPRCDKTFLNVEGIKYHCGLF